MKPKKITAIFAILLLCVLAACDSGGGNSKTTDDGINDGFSINAADSTVKWDSAVWNSSRWGK